MGEANAYLLTDAGETLAMESVDDVSPEGDGLKRVNIFGEQKFLRAAIHALSLGGPQGVSQGVGPLKVATDPR